MINRIGKNISTMVIVVTIIELVTKVGIVIVVVKVADEDVDRKMGRGGVKFN